MSFRCHLAPLSAQFENVNQGRGIVPPLHSAETKITLKRDGRC